MEVDEIPNLIFNVDEIVNGNQYILTRNGENVVAEEQDEIVQNLNVVNENRFFLTRQNGQVIPVENETMSLITNVDDIVSGNQYILTRNGENLVAEEQDEIVQNLNVVNENRFFLTRQNGQVIPVENETMSLITNVDDIVSGNQYTLTRNGDDVVVEEQNELVENLNTVNENRFFLTRQNGQVVPVENNFISIRRDSVNDDGDYVIRKVGDNFFFTPSNSNSNTNSLVEYIFESESAKINARFTVGGVSNSRIAYVINQDCLAVRFGILHFDIQTFTGFLDQTHSFEIIVNNINNRSQIVVPAVTTRNPISQTVDISNLNIRLNRGGTIGLRFVDGSTGFFIRCTVTVDTNV